MEQHRHVFGVGAEVEFDEARFIITNAYTGGSDDLKKTWDGAPKHRDAAFNAYCAAELDYDRGTTSCNWGVSIWLRSGAT